MLLKGKNKYLTQVIWIGMGGYVRDKCNGCLLNFNTGFDSFMGGVNGCACLGHY